MSDYAVPVSDSSEPFPGPRQEPPAAPPPAPAWLLLATSLVLTVFSMLGLVLAMDWMNSPKIMPRQPGERFWFVVGVLCCPTLFAVPAFGFLALFVRRVKEERIGRRQGTRLGNANRG